MKYRSPSPMPVDSLPTPPESPRTDPTEPATHLLDHIHAFYQKEQSWVHQTRAALELTLAKGADGNSLILSSSNDLDAPSPASSCTSTDSPPPTTMSVHIKPDPDRDGHQGRLALNLELTLDARASRWVRRKNQMRLKLDGIATNKRRPARAPPSEPATRILEMFAELVDARMESCQRISRMVEAAGRKDYCLC